jgi:hypothetical protein
MQHEALWVERIERGHLGKAFVVGMLPSPGTTTNKSGADCHH